MRSMFGTPAKRCEWIYGEPMQPCPKCGSYNLAYRTPIKLSEPLPETPDAKQMLRAWATARKAGATPLEGTAYMVCQDCCHRGPSVDVSGRTSDDVGQDQAVAQAIKAAWNGQPRAMEATR